MGISVEQSATTCKTFARCGHRTCFFIEDLLHTSLFFPLIFQALIVLFELRDSYFGPRINIAPMMAKRICTIHGSRGNGMMSEMLLELAEVGRSSNRSRRAKANNTAPETNITRRIRFARRGSEGIRNRPAVTMRMPQNRRKISAAPQVPFSPRQNAVPVSEFLSPSQDCASRISETQDVQPCRTCPFYNVVRYHSKMDVCNDKDDCC